MSASASSAGTAGIGSKTAFWASAALSYGVGSERGAQALGTGNAAAQLGLGLGLGPGLGASSARGAGIGVGSRFRAAKLVLRPQSRNKGRGLIHRRTLAGSRFAKSPQQRKI